MIDLIEILIGMFVTVAIFYARYCYGLRAALEVIAFLTVAFVLAVFYVTEIMKSVTEETEETGKKQPFRNTVTSVVDQAGYRMMLGCERGFRKLADYFAEALEEYEEGDDTHE